MPITIQNAWENHYQCSGIEREQRPIRRRDLDKLRRERENNEDAQERLAFIKHNLI